MTSVSARMPESARALLLADLRMVFAGQGGDRLAFADIVEALARAAAGGLSITERAQFSPGRTTQRPTAKLMRVASF